MKSRSFYCKRCSNKLDLDESLKHLRKVQLDLILDRRKKDESENDYVERLNAEEFIPGDRLELYQKVSHNDLEALKKIDNIDSEQTEETGTLSPNSFVLLSTEIDNGKKGSKGENDEDYYLKISERINTLKKIFEILSDNQDIDHPLCIDCSKLILVNYRHKFDQNQREKEYYISFLRKLKERESKDTTNDIDPRLQSLASEYEQLQTREKEKLDTLRGLEKQKDELGSQLVALRDALNLLCQNEVEAMYMLRNNLEIDLDQKFHKLDQVKALYQTHLNQLDSLRNMNIYTHIFNISFDEKNLHGTINGLRLGYKVPWPEINAALGQVLLLLIFLLKRLQLDLKEYRLVPMGSRSHIVKYLSSQNSRETQRKSVLNLYSSNDFSLSRLFNFNKLDVAMIALLDVVSKIKEKVSAFDREIELPYIISPKCDTIGNKSIRPSSNAEWSFSCRFLLIDLKWLLTYTSAHTKPSFKD